MVRRVIEGVTAEQVGEVVVDDQQLLNDCIRILRASGELGQLRLPDTVQLVAQVTPIRNVTISEPITVDQNDPTLLGMVRGQNHFRSLDFNSAGIVTNPAANAVLADTGALVSPADPRQYKIVVTADTTTAIDFRVQHRDAANAANVIEIPLVANAGSFSFVHDFGYRIDAANERIRIVAGSAMTGDVAASILQRRTDGILSP